MSYTSNPYAFSARKLGVNDVLVRHLTNVFVARKYGVHRSTIDRWLKKAHKCRSSYIYTQSSRPNHHPSQLPEGVVKEVINLRSRYRKCAPVLHAMLKDRGVNISVSSVKRILKRYNLTRKRKQIKPPYAKIQRPRPETPGALVEMDTIHFIDNAGKRFFIYVAIDVYSRVGYAQYSQRINCLRSYLFTLNALKYFNFKVSVIQTDNGGEFAEGFYFYLRRLGIQLRHTRIRKPNDNAHVERFIRTIQEEGFNYRLPNKRTIGKDLKNYLHYYNHERYHLGINCNIPCLFVAKVLN